MPFTCMGGDAQGEAPHTNAGIGATIVRTIFVRSVCECRTAVQYVLECQGSNGSFVRLCKASMDADLRKKRRMKTEEVKLTMRDSMSEKPECTWRERFDVWRPAPLQLIGMGDADGPQGRKCCTARTESLGVAICVSWLDGECCWWPGAAAPRRPSPGRVGPRVIGWCYLAAAGELQFIRVISTVSRSFGLKVVDSCSWVQKRCRGVMCRSSPAPLAGSGEPCRSGGGRARAEIQRRQNDAANAYGEAHVRTGLHRAQWPGAAGVHWCVLLLVWVVGTAVCCVSLRVAACGRRAVRTANSWADQSNVGPDLVSNGSQEPTALQGSKLEDRLFMGVSTYAENFGPVRSVSKSRFLLFASLPAR